MYGRRVPAILGVVATVLLTPHLRRFFADLPGTLEVEASSVRDVVRDLDRRWPGLGFYLVDEQGTLRTHVAVFVDGRRVTDRGRLGDRIPAAARVQIVQALSGG